jgi:aminodeoxychorismate synthase component I
LGDPFEELRRLLGAYRVGQDEYCDHPVPFLSGAVGYIGYEAGYFIESLPDRGIDSLGLPDIWLMFVDSLLAHCHRTGRSYVSAVGRGPDEDAARRAAVSARDQWLQRIAAFDSLDKNSGRALQNGAEPGSEPPPVAIRAHFDERAYCKAVETVKEHILAGDAYEVCLTHRLEAECQGDPWVLYEELRRFNPAPFASFLKLSEVFVVSSSPERFLRLNPERIVESRPIKGTRPRGQTPEEDEALRRELADSIKDRAENVMIVDLVRNDIGRVSTFGSVHVPELMLIEEYATVFQMVSTIRGTLDPAVDVIDLIKACFPGGSMTGAPKVEAMKIIDRLEPVKRGIYSGSIGYLDFSGVLDLNIVIRTLVVKDGRAYFNVGGAIVADSEPSDEYQETMAKARALIRALSHLAGRASA